MANKKPLVIGSNGTVEQLQAGDIIDVGAAKQVFTATNNNAGAVTIGQPVYVDGAGTVDLAQASTSTAAKVIGLVNDASVASAGSGVIITDGVLTSSDWTAVIGATDLTAGSVYFLDGATAGKLTTTPVTVTGNTLIRVGTALSTTEFEISIGEPIKL